MSIAISSPEFSDALRAAAVHAARRTRLLERLDEAIAIIPTAPERIRNRDAHYPYRADSYFWYLSGFGEPEAVIVLLGKNGDAAAQSLLFCRERNEEREMWDGRRFGPDAAKDRYAFDAAYPIDTLAERLPELLAGRRTVFYPLGADAAWDSQLLDALNTVRGQTRSGQRAPEALRDVRALIDPMRLIKDESERDTMRRAARISSSGHERAMRACRPGLHEYALEAELTCEFRRQGADAHAYTPIVAAGENACILHYVENNRLLREGELVLIDSGCECSAYASDITRTFPVNGRFSAVQKNVYEIVLAAQNAAIAAIKPGESFMAPHEAALRILVQGMIDLKLLDGSLDGLIENESYKRFYPHRTGHWLGLDVHDAGEYKDGENWITLIPGMVLTVEPGLYIRAADDVPAELHNIGIRIEDDALVTADGCEIYTHAPKTVAEIEAVMRHD